MWNSLIFRRGAGHGLAALFAVCLFAAQAWGVGTPEELAPGMYAKIKTSGEEVVFELDYRNTPLTVTNFAGLAKGVLRNSARKPGEPFFDGISVYRVVKGYAVFTGDPDGNGEGGPGYSLPREKSAVISAGEPGTLVMDGLATESAGSRFFIMLHGDSFLDSKYTSFGRLIYGMNILNRLKPGSVIDSVEIIKIGAEAEAFVLNQDAFDARLAIGREREVEDLKALNPALPDVVRGLGEGKRKTRTGIYYAVLQEGQGASPKVGNLTAIHYTGSFVDGAVFDSTKTRGKTFDFIIGRDSLIPGWIEMVIGMKIGEIRKVVMPPEMAYGKRGYGPIEPDSWLIFEIELVSFSEG